jgi:hypothetical protein
MVERDSPVRVRTSGNRNNLGDLAPRSSSILGLDALEVVGGTALAKRDAREGSRSCGAFSRGGMLCTSRVDLGFNMVFRQSGGVRLTCSE